MTDRVQKMQKIEEKPHNVEDAFEHWQRAGWHHYIAKAELRKSIAEVKKSNITVCIA